MARHSAVQIVTFILCAILISGRCHLLTHDQQNATIEEMCKALTENPTLRHVISEAQRRSTACPCTQSIIEQDMTFSLEQDCYTQLLYDNGAKQTCCYDNYGNLISGGTNSGYLVVEQFENEILSARRACCVDSDTCEEFHNLNPPDDCSRYKPPHSVKSWGDPHIKTLDEHEYTFNGHGEYLFLLHNDSKGELQIQARTVYQNEGNFDATMFGAFVITTRSGNDSDLISVILNDTASGISSFFEDDTPIPINKDQPSQSKDFKIIQPTNKVVTIMASIYITISYNTDLGLDIKLTFRQPFNGTGLAGNAEGDNFIGRDGTQYMTNSTEYLLFNYSESWSLSENESNFHYNLTGGDYTLYNSNHTTPRFLEQLTGDLSALFEGWSDENITLFNTTCFMEWKDDVSTDCLLAIARSNTIEAGTATVAELKRQYDKERELNNKEPTFTEAMITHMHVNFSDTEPFTIDLSNYVTDPNNDTLTFEVETNINASSYSLNTSTGLFTWNVDDQGRLEAIDLTFVVHDEFSSTPSTISISYCGCVKEQDCNFGYIEPTDSKSTSEFERFGCACTGQYSSGRFCESRLNPCDITNCTYADFNITCDELSEKENPCGPCPDRYGVSFDSETRQQTCKDIDECANNDWCDHTCENSIGGFKCYCYRGFLLDSKSNRSCIDIDACAIGTKTCETNEVCSDPQGNATCVCVPGYSKENGGQCKKIEGFSYTFSMSFTLSVPLTPKDVETDEFKKQAKQELYETLNSSIALIDLIITRIYFEASPNTIRKKRDDTPHLELHIDYTVLTKDQTTYKDLKNNMTTVFHTASSLTIGNTTVPLPEDVAVNIPKGGSCSRGYDCDNSTAHCADNDGNVTCECNPGFKHTTKPSKYCIDIDECADKATEARCIHGTCINLYGGWNCTCPVNTAWAKVAEDEYPYHYRCQGNYSYIGNFSFYRTDIGEAWTDNNLTRYIQKLFVIWMNETDAVNSENIPPLKDLYVNTRLLDLDAFEHNITCDLQGHWYNCSFILTLGDAVNVSRLENVFEYGKDQGDLKPSGFCTNATDDCVINGISIYSDTDDILCNLGNECDPLSTTCTVSKGKYHCNCKTGFGRYDEYLCRDIDECSNSNFTCSNGGSCVNLEYGNWTCSCPPGHKAVYLNYQSINCTDIDECADNTTYICEYGTCANTAGNWNCSCTTGFKPHNVTEDYRTCIDFDECSEGNFNCSNGGNCVNLETGNWTCSCPDGYKTVYWHYNSISCEDIDECEDNSTYICEHGTCNNTAGNWNCSCTTGFNPHNVTEDYRTCIDFDECFEGNFSCSNGGTCVNLEKGNWTCSCPDGYKTVFQDYNNIICEDIDECADNTTYICELGTCNNTEGNWNCSCTTGFKPHDITEDYRTCIDFDECSEGNFTCSNGGTCLNLENGNWTCSCPGGYKTVFLDYNNINCEDIDECADNITYICEHGKCTNTEGNWNCSCTTGFKPHNVTEDYRTCIDFDECSEGNFNCSNDGTCVNLENGNWTCSCPDGYKTVYWDYYNITCEDIDECADNTTYICEHGTCTNTEGNWNCSCTTGFKPHNVTEDYRTCIDIDECAEKEIEIRCIDGTCSNLYGGWNCTCPFNTTWAKVADDVYPYHYRCQGNYSYFGNISFYRADPEVKWVEENITNYIKDLFLIWMDNETIATTNKATPLKDLFLTTKAFDLNASQDIIHEISHGYWYNFSFILTFGDVVNISRIDDVFQTGNHSGLLPDGVCTNELDDCKIFEMTFYKDTDDILCNLGNECDPFSTACTVSKGKYHCNCKTGFGIYDEYSCRDIKECEMDREYFCLNRGECHDLEGNWTCDCPEGYMAVILNRTHIDCAGSNAYNYATELNTTRELNENEKTDITKALEQKLSEQYAGNLKDVTVTIVVTIEEIPRNSSRRRRETNTNNKTTYGYKLVTHIYSNAPNIEDDIVKAANNVSIVNTIWNTTNTKPSVPTNKPLTINKQGQTNSNTTTTVLPVPARCIPNCANGGTCYLEGNISRCSCPATYNGTTCEVKIEPKADSEVADLKIILFSTAGGLGGLVLLLVLVIIFVCRRNTKRQRKSRKEEEISLGPMGNKLRNDIYIAQDYKTTDVDKMSLGSTFSHQYRPGQLPRIHSMVEPKPDYEPPPLFKKPESRSSPRPDYRRSGSPTPDYRDGRLPRTSDSSHDSGMDLSRGSLNLERRKRDQGNTPMRMAANRRSQPIFTHSNHL